MVELMNPATMLREMTGIMTNPLNMFSLGQRLLTGSVRQPRQGRGGAADTPRPSPGGGAAAARGGAAPAPRFADLLELDARPGQAGAMVDIIAGSTGRPGGRPNDGLIDVVVLQSMADPNRVTAISFWENRESSTRFDAGWSGWLGDSLTGVLAAPPRRRAYTVAASTIPSIGGSGRQ
jgi:hypothetical protein